MKPWVGAWLTRHGLPGWLVPDYFKLAVIAALVASLIALRLAARDRASPMHTARAIACAYLGALAGGYAFEAVRALPLALASGVWRPVFHPGRAAYGGLLAAIGAAALYLMATRQPIAAFFDRIAVGAGLSFAFVRTGCFLAGCDYGLPTAQAWGVRFPPGSLAALEHARRGFIPPGAPSLPVHPTQLYEAALGLLAAALAFLALLLSTRGHRDGRAFAVFLGVYAAGRFAIEFLRGDQDRGHALGFSTAQWVSLAIAGVAVFQLLHHPRRVARRRGVTGELAIPTCAVRAPGS